MREVGTPCSRFTIVEHNDSDYHLRLARKDHNGDLTEMRLYGVVVKLPFGSETVFVLAESEDGAKSQASCLIDGDLANQMHKVGQQAEYCVKQVPLMIRGWSGTKF